MPKNNRSSNTLNNAFKKKKQAEVLRKWGIRLFGFCIITLFFVGLYFATKIFSFASEPMREFQQFRRDERTEIRPTQQTYVGIWYEIAPGSPKRNAIAIFSPERTSITIFTLPDDISAKDPESLQREIALPIDRYIMIPYAVTQGEDLNAFVQDIAAEWYTNYSGIMGYVKLPEVIERVAGVIYTDASPRELSWLARFSSAVSREDITVRTWPSNSFNMEQIRLSYLVDPAISKAANRVWIRNNTDIPGLATAVSSLMVNLGFEIVRVDTFDCAEADFDTCDSNTTRLLVNQTLASDYAVQRVRSVLDGVVEVSSTEDLKRADIVVLVGENARHLVGD